MRDCSLFYKIGYHLILINNLSRSSINLKLKILNNTIFFPSKNFFYISQTCKTVKFLYSKQLKHILHRQSTNNNQDTQNPNSSPRKRPILIQIPPLYFPFPSPRPFLLSFPSSPHSPALSFPSINRCQYDIIHENMMIEQYFTKYYITIFQIFLLRDQPSTMQELNNLPIETIPRVKFPKSSSMSSLKTESDIFFEKDLLTRKVSDQQKYKLINLITNENFNMKDAAKYVHISYSTAKKVVSRFRRARKEEMRKKIAVRRCGLEAGYHVVSMEKMMGIGKLAIFSTIAGAIQENNQENGIYFNE